MDRLPYAGVGAAPANVIPKGAIDIGIGRVRVSFQQSDRAHDLAGLAIAALGHVQFQPCLLNRVAPVAGQTVNGADLGAAYIGDGHLAASLLLAVKDDRAGAASANPASKLGPRQPQQVAQNPQPRCVGRRIDVMGLAEQTMRSLG